MHDLLSQILMLAIAATAATLVGAAIAWWIEEHRRLARIAGRVLGGAPDGLIIAQGRGAAAAFRLDAGKVLVMRDGGAHALLYPLSKLNGAELLVDEHVVARVAEGEPRRLLDRIPTTASHVALRLVFDDARHPDFILDLWLPSDAGRRHARAAPIVIQEARGWLTRAEAILRRNAAPPPVAVPPPPKPEPEPIAALEDEDDYEGEDDGPPWDEPEAEDLDHELDIEAAPAPALPLDETEPPASATDLASPNQQLKLF